MASATVKPMYCVGRHRSSFHFFFARENSSGRDSVGVIGGVNCLPPSLPCKVLFLPSTPRQVRFPAAYALHARDRRLMQGRYSPHRTALLRSRGTRERILILFRQQESRFLGLQIGRPSKFLQGLWASFLCPVAQNEARSCFGVFRSVRRIVVFLELVFTPMAIDKKKCSPSADWTELF